MTSIRVISHSLHQEKRSPGSTGSKFNSEIEGPLCTYYCFQFSGFVFFFFFLRFWVRERVGLWFKGPFPPVSLSCLVTPFVVSCILFCYIMCLRRRRNGTQGSTGAGPGPPWCLNTAALRSRSPLTTLTQSGASLCMKLFHAVAFPSKEHLSIISQHSWGWGDGSVWKALARKMWGTELGRGHREVRMAEAPSVSRTLKVCWGVVGSMERPTPMRMVARTADSGCQPVASTCMFTHSATLINKHTHAHTKKMISLMKQWSLNQYHFNI